MRRILKVLSFYTIAPKIMVICYTVPGIWRVTNVIVTFHFGLFSVLSLTSPPPFTRNSPKSKHFKKMKKLVFDGFSAKVYLRFHRWCFFLPEKELFSWTYLLKKTPRRTKVLKSAVWNKILKIWDKLFKLFFFSSFVVFPILKICI